MSDFWSEPSSTSLLYVCGQRRLWRDCVDAQAPLSLRWPPMWSHELAQISGKWWQSLLKLSHMIDSLTRSHKIYCNDPKFSDRQVWANGVDPDQTTSDQGLRCLPFRLHLLSTLLELRHDKTNKMSVCPAKTQISQSDQSSLSAWRKLGS